LVGEGIEYERNKVRIDNVAISELKRKAIQSSGDQTLISLRETIHAGFGRNEDKLNRNGTNSITQLIEEKSLSHEIEVLNDSSVTLRLPLMKQKLIDLRREKACLVRKLDELNTVHKKSVANLKNELLQLQARYTQHLKKSFETHSKNLGVYQRVRKSSIAEISEMTQKIFRTYQDIYAKVLHVDAIDLNESRRFLAPTLARSDSLIFMFTETLERIREMPISAIQDRLDCRLRELERFKELSVRKESLLEENRLLKYVSKTVRY
jgi:hypothetical protein